MITHLGKSRKCIPCSLPQGPHRRLGIDKRTSFMLNTILLGEDSASARREAAGNCGEVPCWPLHTWKGEISTNGSIKIQAQKKKA